jgi:hypothetical protein
MMLVHETSENGETIVINILNWSVYSDLVDSSR